MFHLVCLLAVVVDTSTLLQICSNFVGLPQLAMHA